MALTPSGTISFADINTATGKSSTASISLSGTAARCISNTAAATAVSMSQLRNKTCAGGTITVGTLTQTIKGVTTTRYGMSSGSYGSATLGNLTTYPGLSTVTGFGAFFTGASGNQSPPFSLWSGQFNLLSPTAISSWSGPRVRVGSNDPRPTITTVTYVGGTSVNSLSTSTPSGIMIAANVGQTLDWVISQ